jgi:transcriptional regulator with XRE-family HTH domain
MPELLTYKIAFDSLKKIGIIRNQQHLADILDVNKATISQILNGNIDPPKHFVDLFTKHFSSFSRDWLLTGEGEMIIAKDKEYTIPESEKNITAEPPEIYNDNQTRLIRMQEQLLENNTRLMAGQEKLIDTNSKLAAQIIELCSKNPQNEVLEKLETFSKELQEFRNESKNAHARGDVGCADVG